MNKEQIQSLVRDGFKLIGMFAIMKGVGDATAWEAIGGGVIAAVGVIWSQVFHTVTAPVERTTP